MEGGDTGKRPLAPTPDLEDATDDRKKKKKRAMVSMACNSCRSKKIKCDGRRPTCTLCAARSRTCRYESDLPRSGRLNALRLDNQVLREEVASLRGQLDHLRSQSAPTLSAPSSPSYRGQVTDPQASSTHGSQASSSIIFDPSYHHTLRATLPPTMSQLEFELMCKHPNAYQVLEPYQDPEAVAKTVLSFGDQPAESSDTTSLSPARIARPANMLCDDRLSGLEIAYWTTVPISNEKAASILSLYLENQHPILGTFDAGLFIQGLVEQQLRFCSPFLVNAVLYYGCQAYTVFDLGAAHLSWAFYAEAKKLWQASRSCDSLMNVAALQIMCLAGSCNGCDQEGREFFHLCQDMAERLDLSGDTYGPTDLANPSAENPIGDDLRFRSHIAWGSFMVANAYASYCQRPPTKSIPSLPMPGLPGFALPDYMGSTITLLCKLWLIGRECAILYGDEKNITSQVPLAAMELKYQQLLAFADELNSSQNVLMSHHAAIVHIWYHTAIITLMHPWVGRQLALHTFSSASSPESITDASSRQLKRLMINYRLYYPQAKYNVHWHLCLIFIANSALADASRDPEWQFYFMACLYGYGVLFPAYRLAELCFRGLLTVALEKGRIHRKKARRFLRELKSRGEHHRVADENVYSGMRLELDTGDSEGRPGTVGDFAARFESIALHDANSDDMNDDVSDTSNTDKYNALFDELINLDDDQSGELALVHGN